MRGQTCFRLIVTAIMAVLLLSLCACAGGGTVSSGPEGDGAVETTTTTSSATTTKKIPTTVKHNVNDTEKPSATSTTVSAVGYNERICFLYPDGTPAKDALVCWINADGTMDEKFEDMWYVTNEKGIITWKKEYGSVKGVEFRVGYSGEEDKYRVTEFTTEKTENEIIYTFILKQENDWELQRRRKG